ncbi:MAG: bifunctional DNA primase/polymerase, partial [Acidobacteriia bacterium]|nr:bifunctional DNA primase/polymerase [Terriglobia bacterium]
MEADKQTVDSQLDNALNALARGFAVFPCEPRSKRPAGKVVPNGVKQASTDEATIRGWWKINPDFNPAITGGVIVDADSGLNSLKEATNFALLNDFPPTLIVRTGRRDSYGAQFHFSGTAVNGLYTANGVAGEIRCKNEYGMAPGAIHPITGERYEIVVDLRRAVCPSDLLKNFRKSSPSPKEPNAGFKVGEGERFYWLRSQCGRLVNAGLSGAALFAALKSLNEKFCEPPKPDSVLQELADAGTAKFSANVQPPPSQRRKVYGEERIRFLTEKAERFYRPNFPEHLMYYELSDHNAVSCVPPLPRGELRHLSVHVYERLSGETVRTYPGMFEDDEQNATDTGYGKHFIRDHGSFVRYNSETREWLTYWKGVWRVTHDDVAVARYFKEQWIEREKAVKASLASLAPGVSAIDAKEAGDSKYVISMLESSILELYKNEKRKLAYALNGQESRNINSALELARTEDGIQISNVDLDSDPLLFNCLNMALDLRTSEPVQHRIDLLCTKQSPVTTSTRASSLMEDYEEDVCPEFERILSRSLPDESTREYLQDFFGLCLSGLMV